MESLKTALGLRVKVYMTDGADFIGTIEKPVLEGSIARVSKQGGGVADLYDGDKWDVIDPRNNLCPIIPVIFRMWKGDVIALFPSLPAGEYTCSSFMVVGGHSGADYQEVMQHSRPATPEEYADIKKVLESPPYYYRLKVYKRATRKHHEERRKGLWFVQY